MYLQLHAGFRNHPKVKRLCLVLSDARAWSYPVGLWEWATTYAQDGQLGRFEVGDIEAACDWTGEEGVLVAALLKVRLLDRSDDGSLSIHDWGDWGGAFFEARATDAARKREKRRQLRIVPSDTSSGRPRTQADVRPTSAEVVRTAIPGEERREDQRRGADPDRARARGPTNGMARIATKTIPFKRVWEVYASIRGEAEAAAAAVFAEASAEFPGGEEALAETILTALRWQKPIFEQQPWEKRPQLAAYIAGSRDRPGGRRWEDRPPPAQSSGYSAL